MYAEIKSKFVKKEVKKTAWKDREYIDHLMSIEKFALGTYVSSGHGYIRNILKGRYPEQWKAIWLELNPLLYKEIVKREKREKVKEMKEEVKWNKEEREVLLREKREWEKLK